MMHTCSRHAAWDPHRVWGVEFRESGIWCVACPVGGGGGDLLHRCGDGHDLHDRLAQPILVVPSGCGVRG